MSSPRTSSMWADVKTYRKAYILTAITSFGGMLFGWDTGLIGGVLTMSSFQHSFNLNPKSHAFSNLSGNIVSVLQAGCFFGAAASFWISDAFGRRTALIIADAIFLFGSILQTCSGIGTKNLALLYVGRVIGGFGVGLISAVVPTFIGENVNKEIRGRCIGCMQLFNVTGIMLSYFVNYGVSKHMSPTSAAQWRVPFALQMLPGLLLLAGIVFQNESPRWLVEKNRHEDARKALARVRDKPADDPTVELELAEIIEDFHGHEKMPLVGQLKVVASDRKIFYRFAMAIALMFWQQWTGTNSINYYSPQIFRSIGLGNNAGLFATGIYGVVKVVITSLGLLFMTEQLGRKWSLIIGALGQAFAMFYIGVNQAVNPVVVGAPLNGNSTFAIVCIYLFVVFYSFGWGPIPFVLSAECAPNHVRSLIMASALMTQWLFNFVIAKLTPIMLADITYGTFLLFGSCCIAMCMFAIFFIPETKNVPLESIYLLFEGNIVKGALRDVNPKHSRAKGLKDASNVVHDDDFGAKRNIATHVEHVKGV